MGASESDSGARCPNCGSHDPAIRNAQSPVDTSPCRDAWHGGGGEGA